MTLLENLFVGSAIVCVACTVVPARMRRSAAAGAAVVFVAASVAVLLTQGLRWQLTGVLVAGVLSLALAVLRIATGRPRGWVGGTFFGLGVTAALGSMLVGAISLWGFRPLDLPEPGGEHPVGTTVAYWTDAKRPEPGTPEKDDKRNVTAQIWYPATASGAAAPYLGQQAELVSEGLGSSLGVPSFLLSEAAKGHNHSTTDAELATGGQFGVVLFSPGLLGVRTQNTAWAEFLAARGYVVVALDHPYDSATTVTPDGRAIRSTLQATGDEGRDEANTNRATGIRAADLSFALDQLVAMPMFQNRLDLDRVAVAGHSAGGAAALQAAAHDGRFRAAIDIDGLPRNNARPSQPVLVLVAGDGTGNPENDAEYAAAVADVVKNSSGGREITVENTKHLSFTDAPFLLPPVPTLFGSKSPQAAYAATTSATLQFLDKVFSGPDAGASE
ncbi:alpha/beta fold hydrolase [Kineosporia rhizophila]|uniref:alpha/beta hydrolase family protein n=1 Tax=Kineosporia rhizophila TaxID=84633 RepID=UPI001E38F7CD|nr:alpha/beta fold hydrolase [Kineosporia rhizophila]MCE0539116.1 alpha/beta fold hydrolase [Kineosporia rhizophila]